MDVGAKKLILDYLKKLNREDGITIVVTSSELNELRSICDRIAVVANGRITGTLQADEMYGMLMMNTIKHENEGGTAS